MLAFFFIPKITLKLYSVYSKVNKLHVRSSLKGEGPKNKGNQETGRAGRALRPESTLSPSIHMRSQTW